MTRLLRTEQGTTLVTAIVLLAIMLTAGFALAGLVDTQTKLSATTRVRETAFNLDEAALNAQVRALAQPGMWPASAAPAQQYPVCVPASSDARCPNAGELRSLFPTSDAEPGATWRTEIADNTDPYGDFWSDALLASAQRYDANGDGRVWVRATATAAGHTRTIVALVRAEAQQEDILHAALLSGRLALSNNGNKTVIDDRGSGTQPSNVYVRCTPSTTESQPCLGYQLGHGNTQTLSDLYGQLYTQVSPADTAFSQYTGPQALTPDALARLRSTAISYGTYYPNGSVSCPSTLAGKVVWIDDADACPSFAGNAVYNSSAEPGMLIVNHGSLRLTGSQWFYGVIYHAPQTTDAVLVDLGGNVCVRGGVIVDDPVGTTSVGSSGNACDGEGNIGFDPVAFGSVKSLGTAGIVQNTWRELTAGNGR